MNDVIHPFHPFFDESEQVLGYEQHAAVNEFSGAGIRDIYDLATCATEPDHWIFDGLIERGDQVLLAGAPKTGKSLLASQLSLAAAAGSGFMSWRAVAQKKVLYVNLEVREKWFARRVERQIDVACDNEKRLSFSNFFSFSLQRSIDVLSKKDCAMLESKIGWLGPDLIVFDVFSRLHESDEVDPRAMRKVMMQFRNLSSGAAHVIVIHTRKADKSSPTAQTAADIKGSAAIFGECDTAIVLSKTEVAGEKKITLVVESRNAPGAYKPVCFDARTLTFSDTNAAVSSGSSAPVPASSAAVLEYSRASQSGASQKSEKELRYEFR